MLSMVLQLSHILQPPTSMNEERLIHGFVETDTKSYIPAACYNGVLTQMNFKPCDSSQQGVSNEQEPSLQSKIAHLKLRVNCLNQCIVFKEPLVIEIKSFNI